ncbi:MAG: M48 family metallopeptidase [Hyphomonadaceae bacterium]
MQARYADGRSATITDAEAAIEADAIAFAIQGVVHRWRYAELVRADDGNGRIILKRLPDTGERLSLEAAAEPLMRAQAPALFTRRAHGDESWRLVGGLAGAALGLATIFLVAVPLAAGPLARVMPAQYRAQIGEIAWSQVEALSEPCAGGRSAEAESILQGMALRFLDAGAAAEPALRNELTISIVDAGFPNAFALPDNSIVVTDDLIAEARHPDELAGVIAHELAHLSRHHVMENVIRNVGAGVFFDIVFGGAGLGQAVAVASVNLAALSYSRHHETEADGVGLDYLEAAGVDPAALARFFERIQQITGGEGDVPTFLSSHPATPARIAAARARAQPGRAPSLSAADWSIVQNACAGALAPAQQVAPAAKAPEAEPPVNKDKPL